MHTTDVLVIGSGIAGAVHALELAKKKIHVTLLSADQKEHKSSSYLAQGGIVYQGKNDSKELLSQDIHAAGGELCYPKAVEQLVTIGPSYLKQFLVDELGIDFDKDSEGELSLTMEAAHQLPRIVHHKDCTGTAVMNRLYEEIEKSPYIDFKKGQLAVDLITLSHHSTNPQDLYHPSTCVGAFVFDENHGKVFTYLAKHTVLATGGLGELFLHTTNSKIACGSGVALAYRAGARIMNMEYVQFHPTSLYVPNEKRFLISEALRGEGGEILAWDGTPFMQNYHPLGSLAPRDVTSRAIYRQMIYDNAPHLWLDISFKDSAYLKDRFPTIYQWCMSKNLDLTKEPLPIVPAAHYSCGGIAVDGNGATSIERLSAIGEVACTGVHGSNRLASTSLLEGMVWGKQCAESLASQIKTNEYYFPKVEDWVMGTKKVDRALIAQDWIQIKQTMWNYVGLERDRERLCRAKRILQELKWQIDSFYSKAELSTDLLLLRHGIQTSLLIAEGAFKNRHSQGCHFRQN